MSGLVKAKNYDWKDTNLALFGSDTEKNVKKEAAENEPAWKGAGQNVGLQIWRINKFKVDTLPEEEYGKFYNGDSYIILNTYKEQDKIKYDVHFWIGKHSTQDEYGTAAYKTVELDTFLDDEPIQHREVENHESKLFLSYFKEIQILEGGNESGFRHVDTEGKKAPQIFRISGSKKKGTFKVVQVPCCKKSLHQSDVYYIDCGDDNAFQWNGEDAGMMTKYESGQFISSLRSKNGGKTSLEVLDNMLEGICPEERLQELIPDDLDEEYQEEVEDDHTTEKVLLRLSDADGTLDYQVVARGKDVNIKTQLKSDDVYILDCANDCFVWVGKHASPAERHNSMSYAHNYLMGTHHPLNPITCLKEGFESKEFFKS